MKHLSALALPFLLPTKSFSAPAEPMRFEFSASGSATRSGDADYAGVTHGSVEAAWPSAAASNILIAT